MDFSLALNIFGVNTIVFLQSTFPRWEYFFMSISSIGDPALVFSFYFPFVAAFSLKLASSLLWTAILCEWSNMILKWLLAGDRPFWWVHESPYYIHKPLPYVRQLPLTCETGPGNPSGHSTLNAAMFYLLTGAIVSALQPYLQRLLAEQYRKWINRVLWISYGLWICLIIISRIYLGTHFPHQCIVGALIGIVTAVLIDYIPYFKQMNKKKTVLLTFLILSSVGTIFGIYRAFGNDPMWSMVKAIRWCIKKEYIHVDTTPFYSLSRYAGACFGLGMALSSSNYDKLDLSRFSWKMRLSLVIFTSMTGQASRFIHSLLPSTIFGYYILQFLLNGSMVYCIMELLPRFVMVASGVKPKAKIRKH